jgi:pimeloyl-ACP methyl ester carboxylesterase
MDSGLYVERQGNPANPVLLLHGLGCNGAVWDSLVPLLLKNGFGPIVPDFCGHGRSAWAPDYSIEQQAAAVAAAVPRGRPVKVIGHSMGATVGLLLASGCFGVHVSSLFAVGLKIDWSQEEMDRMGEIRPIRQFATRGEAAQRFLRVTGLAGLIDQHHRCVQAGLVSEATGFRLATDPKTVSVVRDPVGPLLASARALGLPLRLSCGSEDRLLDVASLRKWDDGAIVFQGYGHNVHVEAKVMMEAFLEQDVRTS